MYELEIETNKTVKRIKDPRKVKVVDAFFTFFIRIMDGNGNWTNIGHCFYYQDAIYIAFKIKQAIKSKETFIGINL